MDEKIKHRIVGAFVLLSLLTIFIPVAFRNHNAYERNMNKPEFYIPPPPAAKKLTLPEFKSEPVAQVEHKSSVIEPTPGKSTHVSNKITESKKKAPIIAKTDNKRAVTAKAWVIQLASFSDANHAKSLAKDLQKKGYAAYTTTSKNSKGVSISRVQIGPEIKRQNALQIQTKLAQLTNIKGIVIEFDPRVKSA